MGFSAAKLLAGLGAVVGVLAKVAGRPERSCPLVAYFVDADQSRAGIDAPPPDAGRLDFVFANAGVNGVRGPITELQVDAFNATAQANVRATFLITTAAMTPPWGPGSVIFAPGVSDARAFPNGGATAYSTRRAGQPATGKAPAPELGTTDPRAIVIRLRAIEFSFVLDAEERYSGKIMSPDAPQGLAPPTSGATGNAEDVAKPAHCPFSGRARPVAGAEIRTDRPKSLDLL